MSNHWIRWECEACGRNVTIAAVIEPHWPSGLLHHRQGFCEACFAAHATDFFLIDDSVHAQASDLRTALGERLCERIPRMPGRPKERFLTLGLPDAAARAGAVAWSEYQAALQAKRNNKRSRAWHEIQEMVTACLLPPLTLLTDDERTLLENLAGPTARRENSAMLLTEKSHGESDDGGIGTALDGEHGVFFVVNEGIQIVRPQPDDRERDGE